MWPVRIAAKNWSVTKCTVGRSAPAASNPATVDFPAPGVPLTTTKSPRTPKRYATNCPPNPPSHAAPSTPALRAHPWPAPHQPPPIPTPPVPPPRE
ncbi:hypothetical protein GCM10029976_088910 [Kribbella albertanoniae]